MSGSGRRIALSALMGWTQRDRPMRPRRPAPPQLPAMLAARWDDLVCVVGEANAWHAPPGVAAPPPELVH